MVVHYDASGPIIQVLLARRGTILPVVAALPFFWFLLAAHVALFQYNETRRCPTQRELDIEPDKLVREDCGSLPKLEWYVVDMPASLLVFFVVFYGRNCYVRFYEMWSGVARSPPAQTPPAQTDRVCVCYARQDALLRAP